MNKFAIVTRADDNIKDMADITLPIMRDYAERCNADFIVLSEDAPFLTEDHKPHYRILKVVPEDMIGSIYEDKGSRRPDRLVKLQGIQQAWGDVNWKEGYTNAGTFVMSKMHRDIFLPHNGEYWLGWGSADLHLSYNIHKYNFKVHELDYKWNHMSMFSEQWNGSPSRFSSNIIHYAGAGIYDAGVSSRLEQIKRDVKVVWG